MIQENKPIEEQIHLFNNISVTSNLKEVLLSIAKWSQIIGIISMLSVLIATIKLILASDGTSFAVYALAGLIGYLIFKSGNKIEQAIKNYNQNSLQEGFRYLYRYFFISFILYVLLAVVVIPVLIFYL